MSKVALAIGGAALLTAVAVAARVVDGLVGGPRGVLAGMLVYGVVLGTCGLVFRPRPRRQRLPRPAATVPEPAAPAPAVPPARLAA